MRGVPDRSYQPHDRRVSVARFVACWAMMTGNSLRAARLGATLRLILAGALAVGSIQRSPDLTVLFDGAATWNDFLTGVSRQRQTWLQNARSAQPSADAVRRLMLMGPRLRILVIAADWCSDSVQTVPYLAALASEAGIAFRVLDADAARGRALLRAHPTPDGRMATPTVLLLWDGRVAGVWVERPGPLRQMFPGPVSRLSMTQWLDEAARMRAWYAADHGHTTEREIVELAEKVTVGKRDTLTGRTDPRDIWP
jgi:Thioredoxin